MKAHFCKRILRFNNPAGTSRGILLEKPSWYIFLSDKEDPSLYGIGEVSIIPGLSVDDESLIDEKLRGICASINRGSYDFHAVDKKFPAIAFGLETALLDFKTKYTGILYPSDFTLGIQGIRTNGLIWMGSAGEMKSRIKEKLDRGFRCLKMKIGAIDRDRELALLKEVRKEFAQEDLELRVDANGAFSYDEACEVLKRLSDLDVHSIEQPIKPGRSSEMAALCEDPPIPIALDEELIGIRTDDEKEALLEVIKPQYIILKPSLIGGVKESARWIDTAVEKGIGWWATSALESNIGLNAIAQWIATMKTEMHQGLGLGNLYVENITAPLTLQGEELYYRKAGKWDYGFIL